MFQDTLAWLKKNEKISVFLLALLFVLIRLPGVHLPLHQDEYKWPAIVNPAGHSDSYIPHPPLGELIYRTAGYIVGFNVNFRFVPLFFGTLNLLLLYYLMRLLFSRREATIAGLIWIFSYFSVLASLMVDTDGEVLPFFFLTALIAYFKLKTSASRKFLWLGILIGACILGFLVKVSFALAVGAIVADFVWSKRHLITKKEILKYGSFFLLGICGLGIVLLLGKLVFPFFNLNSSLQYWEHFANSSSFLSRGWFQTAIQCVKAVLYSSPLLILAPFFVEKKYFEKVKVFLFFLLFSFIFYVILFDFSLGALDRYLQLLILPLSVLASIVIVRTFENKNKRVKEFFLLGIIISLALVLLQSLPHSVPPLYPKSEWINRVFSFKWNFLYPFSGGSGPLGFYVSFLFMALAWILSFGAVVFGRIKKNKKVLFLGFMLPICVAYNLVFIEEYLIGYWNGSASKLVINAAEFIKNDPDIKFVTVYNDNGGYNVQETGKYRKRLYIDPKFDINAKIASLNQYKEDYLVINIPRIDPTTVYQKYFDTCKVIYDKKDKQISAIIYDCRNAPDIQ